MTPLLLDYYALYEVYTWIGLLSFDADLWHNKRILCNTHQ